MELSPLFFILIGTGVTIGTIVWIALIVRQALRSQWIDSRVRYMTWLLLILIVGAVLGMWISVFFFFIGG